MYIQYNELQIDSSKLRDICLSCPLDVDAYIVVTVMRTIVKDNHFNVNGTIKTFANEITACKMCTIEEYYYFLAKFQISPLEIYPQN